MEMDKTGWAKFTDAEKILLLLDVMNKLSEQVDRLAEVTQTKITELNNGLHELSASLDDQIGDVKYQVFRDLKSDLESQVAAVERKFNNELDSVRRDVSHLDNRVDQAERDISNLERQSRY